MGEQVSNALPNSMKGKLGEGLSFAKSWARGETIPPWETSSDAVELNIPTSAGMAGPQQKVSLPNGRSARPDFLTDWGRALEAKFGNYAKLTRNQKLLIPLLGENFQVDQWLPRDIGDFSGGWFGASFKPAPDQGQEGP